MISKNELTLVFERLDKDQNFSGTILVAQDGEVLFQKAYGFASVQLNVENTLETKYHIASLTKMFVAMATLILSEQERIDLHEKPGAYLPELAGLDSSTTIHHMLSHTSGIQDVYEVPNLRVDVSKLVAEQKSLFSYLSALPQTFAPGEKWSYSSTNYLLMGYILEKITGLLFEEMLKHYVLAPLSIINTGLDLPRRINPGHAYGHTVEDGKLVNGANDELGEFEGPGELYSTVHDLKKWCDALFDCPLVSPETLKLMFTPYAAVDWEPSLKYGYGWFLSPGYRWHGGGTPGFISRIRQYPEQKVSIILLLNSDHVSMEKVFGELGPLITG